MYRDEKIPLKFCAVQYNVLQFTAVELKFKSFPIGTDEEGVVYPTDLTVETYHG